MRTARAYLLAGLVVLSTVVSSAAQTLTDALYNSHHPRLLFTPAELPGLNAKLADGGIDDATYAAVRNTVQTAYPVMPVTDVLGPWYGDQSLPCTGLVGHLEPDDDALALGKSLTLHIVNAYSPDNNEAHSGMRLRALALGYDMFFRSATPAERAAVRDEMVLYIQRMVWTSAYEVLEYRPYLGNHTAMFGAALGLAAIALQGEAPDYLLVDAMDTADRIVENLLQYQFDPDGAYNEGVFYGAWTLKQLVYYFDARHRFDGREYADNPQMQAMEEWFAYELAPEGAGRSHNLNDSALLAAPLSQHPTFFNWAMSSRDSGLAAWLWEHTAGSLGANYGGLTDWSGTILWHRPLAPASPASTLPSSRVWSQRGLYCYRSGWPSGASSDDVVFTFYSGKFQGGHAQEDQNQFALTAYGSRFAVDHGPGAVAKESESHNLVFIDGKGQHNAGSSIGTDGAIVDYLLGSFADFVEGDATAAYGTFSEFNAPDVPYPGADWSWGYSGANPVQHARRSILFVHGAPAPPYALVMDDIDKDGAQHSYQWRMHTASNHTVSATANPVIVAGGSATMSLHLLAPDFSAVSFSTSSYNPGNGEPASTLIRATHTGVNPRFTFLMLPRASNTPGPSVTRAAFAWGCAATIAWGGGVSDVVLRNDSGAPVTYGDVVTDARAAAVRRSGLTVNSYLMAEGQSIVIEGTEYASLNDGVGSCEFSGDTVHLDRAEALFRVLDTGVDRVRCRERDVPFAVADGYVVPEALTGVPAAPAARTLRVSAHPNPFNPVTVIHVQGGGRERVTATIYDVAGRRVRDLWSGVAGEHRMLEWDGRSDDGAPVASGTYFVRVATASQTRTLKLTLLK